MAKKQRNQNSSESDSRYRRRTPPTREMMDLKKPVRGMQTDTSPLNQMPHSYRLAMNMSLESKEGDYSSITNEEGTELCFQILDNEKIIGTILINEGDTIIFIADEEGSYSKISLLRKDCTLTTLIKASCLEFNKSYPIHGVWRLNNGCDRNIYFTDGLNSIRAINLDNLGQYTNQVGNTQEEWITEANTNDTWLCDLLKQNPNVAIPSISLNSIDDVGGQLRVGSYFFAIRYVTQDFNPTSWFYISNPINLGDAAIADVPNHLNQDSGGTVGTPSTTNTGRAINLNITNLDPLFEYYQLAVIQYNDLNGFTPTNVFELPRKPIEGPTDLYRYNGFGDILPITLDEVVIPRISFDIVNSISQVDNRLILANTEVRGRDWSRLQKVASKIGISWETQGVYKAHKNEDFGSSGQQEDASTGRFSFNWRSFSRDEIYALGIVFIYKDGSESPVFHIPGRPADTAYLGGFLADATDLRDFGNNSLHSRNTVPVTDSWDRQILTVIDSALVPGNNEVREQNVKHIPLVEFIGSPAVYIGSEIERWKVFNTATTSLQVPQVARHTTGGGAMAFYEGKNSYPEIYDCEGVDLWGEDIEGNPLIGQPLRHHKFPDIVLAPIDDGQFQNINPPSGGGNGSQIFPMGITVTNIDIPIDIEENLQGFYMVRAKRTENESTVLDTGYLGGTTYIPAGGDPIFLPARHSTANILTDGDVTGNANFENQVCSFISPRTQFRKDLKSGTYLKFEEKTEHSYNDISSNFVGREIVTEDIQFRAQESYMYVDADSIQNPIGSFPYQVANGNINIDIYFTYLSDPKPDLNNSTPIPTRPQHFFCTVKRWFDPYESLFNLSYEKMSNGLNPLPSSPSVVTVERSGDNYIGEMTFRTLNINAKDTQAQGNATWKNGQVWQNFYFQSSLNTELRMTGTEPWEIHWRNTSGGFTDVLDVLQFEGNNAGIGWSLDYFAENFDMTKGNDQRLYYPLPRQFDYCSNCLNRFPTRLWYSQKEYQETASDNYRVFLANDYRDLMGQGGEITNLFTYKDELYAQTPVTSWFVPTRPQQLESNESTISVGTGDVLAVPPKRLETVERGYAGNQDKFSTVSSEFGTTWVDAEAGKVFNFTSQLTELSALGMRSWFAENLKFKDGVNTQIDGFNTHSTVHINGIGFIATFDPRHNRYILTKQYYKIIDAIFLSTLVPTVTYIQGTVSGFNITTGEFYTWVEGDAPTITDVRNDVNKVEDLSWTISYSYPHKAWTSYHSYRPNWFWHTRDTLFSYSNVTEGSSSRYGWKHTSLAYGKFYNKIHPASIYLIFNNNPLYPKLFNDIEILSTSFQWVGNQLVEREDDSFDEVFLHTGRQSSGILNVGVKNNLDTSNPFISLDSDLSNIQIQNNEGVWNYSKFQDLTTDYSLPVMQNEWLNVLYQNKRREDGYIYYPNDARDDFNKNLFQASPLRDKWLGCFMSYSNAEGYKFVVDYLSTLDNISFK